MINENIHPSETTNIGVSKRLSNAWEITKQDRVLRWVYIGTIIARYNLAEQNTKYYAYDCDGELTDVWGNLEEAMVWYHNIIAEVGETAKLQKGGC